MVNHTGYKNNFTEIFDLLAKLDDSVIEFKPAEDKWSIHEIITHLADVEVQSHVRIRTILANKDPRMIYHDQMDWSIVLDYKKVDLNESIDIIKLIRRSNYNLLSRIPSEYFNKKGVHSTKGEMNLEEFISSVVLHACKHFNQMKNNLQLFNNKS